MFKQKQIEPLGIGGRDEQSVKVKPLLSEAPDVHETMKLIGEKDLVLTEEQLRGPREKRRRLLCCCGRSGCGIGPMTRTEEV